jgi:glucan-binding YG repeat protein
VGAYTDSPYYESLQNVILIGDQRRDIVNIALSQVGYCESDSAYDLTGTNAGRSNYTEYGRYTGRQGQAWCASFISWCAYQAGVSTSVIPVTAGANVGSFGTALRYNSSAVQPGDIICFNGGTHVGIVYAKDSEYLYTVEGNYSNQVIALRYALNDSSLTYYYSPNYASVWDVQEGSWYCYDDETEGWQTGWMTIGSSLFYLDPDNDGAAVTGWAEIDGEYYYFAGEPGIMQTGWVQVDGTWYYLGTDGIRQTGWLVLSTGTFYLDPETGAMCTGWQKLGEKWYYFDSNGYEKTGWFYDGCWYYLDPKRAGAMSTGWKTVDGDRYYFNGSGQMMTGWVLIDENWYYFESSGRMVTGEYEIDGTNWFFDKNGVWQEFISQDPELI